ncbi:MAG: hypothetical protein ACK4P4_18245 [Allorhizobium sp.]
MNVIPKIAKAAMAAFQLTTTAARADIQERLQSVMFFGGAMVDENMQGAANVFGSDFENTALVGVGYQMFGYRLGPFGLGLEAGVLGRFGPNTSAEIWGGIVGRHDGIRLGPARLTPSLTFGISHVSNSQKGRKRDHEQERDGNARTLFYLGPGLSLSSETFANTEIFWRLHHRSGAWGTLGDMHGGSNANTIGVRYKF